VNNYLRWSGVVNSSSNKMYMDAAVPAFFDYMTSLMYNTTVKVSIELKLLTDWIYFPPNTKGCAYWRVIFGAASSFRPEPWPDNSLRWVAVVQDMGGPHFIGKGMSLDWINEDKFFSKLLLKNEPIAFVNIYPVINGEAISQSTYPSGYQFYLNAYMVSVVKSDWYNEFTYVNITFNAGASFSVYSCNLFVSHNGKEYPEIKESLETAQQWIDRGFEISSWFFGEASAIAAYFLNVMIGNFIEFLKRELVNALIIICRSDGADVRFVAGAATKHPTAFRAELHYASFYRPTPGNHDGNVYIWHGIRHYDNTYGYLYDNGFTYVEIDYNT
jgi:hypothetical protein